MSVRILLINTLKGLKGKVNSLMVQSDGVESMELDDNFLTDLASDNENGIFRKTWEIKWEKLINQLEMADGIKFHVNLHKNHSFRPNQN